MSAWSANKNSSDIVITTKNLLWHCSRTLLNKYEAQSLYVHSDKRKRLRIHRAETAYMTNHSRFDLTTKRGRFRFWTTNFRWVFIRSVVVADRGSVKLDRVCIRLFYIQQQQADCNVRDASRWYRDNRDSPSYSWANSGTTTNKVRNSYLMQK